MNGRDRLVMPDRWMGVWPVSQIVHQTKGDGRGEKWPMEREIEWRAGRQANQHIDW